MKIAIRYYSETGNVQELATAVSDVLSVESRRVSVPLTEDVDVLFLGTPAAGGNREVKNFLKKNHMRIGTIVSFGTTTLFGSPYKMVKKLTSANKIHLCSRQFYCKRKVDQIDLKEVAAFSWDTVTHIKNHMERSHTKTDTETK